MRGRSAPPAFAAQVVVDCGAEVSQAEVRPCRGVCVEGRVEVLYPKDKPRLRIKKAAELVDFSFGSPGLW